MKLHVYGDKKNCKATQKLRKITDSEAFRALAADACLEVVNVDPSENAAEYRAFKSRYNREGGTWPKLFITDPAGGLLLKMEARTGDIKPYTAAGVMAALRDRCPDCFNEGCSDPGGEPDVTPPAPGPVPAGMCGHCGRPVPVVLCPGCGRVMG